MIRWINKYIGTAAWETVVDLGEFPLLDVRNLVDKGGNTADEVREKIDEGLKILEKSDKLIVCCDFGMSRSNSVAAGIIALKEKMLFYDAVNLVIEKTDEKEIKIDFLDTVQKALAQDAAKSALPGNTLVTGGSGFIAQHLRTMIADGQKDSTIFISTREFNLLEDTIKLNIFCKENNIQTIVHLANPKIYTTSASFGQSVTMLKNVLDVCAQNKIKLIYTSSWEVFSGYKTANLLVNESVKLNPGGTYGQSKMLCEYLVAHHVEQYDLKVIMLRVSPVYGLGADKPKCVWNFAKKAKENQTINTHLYINGLPTIDLLHITDVCNAILQAMKCNKEGIFNIGSGYPTTTKNLAQMIINELNSTSTITHTNLNLITSNITLDITKAMEYLNWKPTVSLEHGLNTIIHSL